MESNPNHQYQDDEITLKELILKLQEYWRYLWGKKWWIIGAGVLAGGLFFLRAYMKPTTYTAELTFMVNEEDGSGGGGVASILGQFGFGGKRGSSVNMDKIIELSKSRRILQGVILEKTEIDGKLDYIGNHIISIYELLNEWEGNSLLNAFSFTQDSIAIFDERERKALQVLHGYLRGTQDNPGLIKSTYDDGTGILSISTTTINEELSVALSEVLFDKLSHFYVDKSIEKQLFTVNVIQEKADSIQRELNSAEYQLAQLQDNSQGFQLRKDQLKQNRLRRQVQVLTVMYGESLKNLEASNFMLKNSTPFFQVIDAPLMPIRPLPKGYLKQVVLGGVLGVGLLTFFLIGQSIYTETMRESKTS